MRHSAPAASRAALVASTASAGRRSVPTRDTTTQVTAVAAARRAAAMTGARRRPGPGARRVRGRRRAAAPRCRGRPPRRRAGPARRVGSIIGCGRPGGQLVVAEVDHQVAGRPSGRRRVPLRIAAAMFEQIGPSARRRSTIASSQSVPPEKSPRRSARRASRRRVSRRGPRRHLAAERPVPHGLAPPRSGRAVRAEECERGPACPAPRPSRAPLRRPRRPAAWRRTTISSSPGRRRGSGSRRGSTGRRPRWTGRARRRRVPP